MRHHLCRLEAAALFLLLLPCALVARLLAPAAPCPRVMPCGPSRGTRRPAVAPPAPVAPLPWEGTDLPAPLGSPAGGGGDQPGGPAPAAPCPPPVLQACSVTSRGPSVAPPALESLRVVELRQLARARGIRTAGGRPVASARKADLREVLA